MTQVTIHERPGRLRRPVLLMAFAGWNDAAESATNAARFLRTAWDGTRIASLDPEEFYHFGLQRPLVRLVPGTLEREIVWPETEFMLCTRAGRDVVVGVSTEPHLRWKTYCGAVIDFARELEVGLIITLGALLAEVPHTKPVRLSGFATDPELAAVLGVRPTRYEGPTGIVGVLSSTAGGSGLATASLWANVPHYISAIENPHATLALLQRVNRLLDGPLDYRELEEAGTQFDAQLSEVLAQNRKVASYVRRLEAKEQEESETAEPGRPGTCPARRTWWPRSSASCGSSRRGPPRSERPGAAGPCGWIAGRREPAPPGVPGGLTGALVMVADSGAPRRPWRLPASGRPRPGPCRSAWHPPPRARETSSLSGCGGRLPRPALEWAGRPLGLFPVEGGQAALVGIDLDVRPGPIEWRVTGAGEARAAGTVVLRSRSFPTQPLTLPKAMVDLDAPALARVASERTTLVAALAGSAPERLWRGAFHVPVVGGQPTGGFGLRRVINGQPRSPHTGFDWAAPTGTPVVAANAGRVVLVAEHFFAGRNVILDHGLGLFTLYYHLDETRVAPGHLVAAGQVIGTVGATGRVTGAHLHFGVLLDGARVDPEALLALPADD